jgi:hypothetical protein
MDSATLKVLKELGIFTSSVTEESSPTSEPLDALAELGINLTPPSKNIPRNDTLELFGLHEFSITPVAIPQKAAEKPAVTSTPSTHSTSRTPTRTTREKAVPKPSPAKKPPRESRINRRETPTRAAQVSNVGEYMYEKGLQFKEAKQEQTEKLFKKVYPFKPALNQHSMNLSSQSKSPRAPLHHPKRIPTPTQQPEDTSQLNQTRSQKINLKEFIKRNYETPLEDYKTRIRRPSQDRDIPDNECTFSPSLNRSSLQIASSAGNNEDIYGRTLKILERRKKWQDDKTKSKQEDEVKDCTFKPKTVDYRSNSAKKARVNLKDTKQLQYAHRKRSIKNSLEASIRQCEDMMHEYE